MATKNLNVENTTPNVENTTQEETPQNNRVQFLKNHCKTYFEDYPDADKFLVVDGEFPEVFLPENEAIAKHSAKQNNRTLYVIAR